MVTLQRTHLIDPSSLGQSYASTYLYYICLCGHFRSVSEIQTSLNVSYLLKGHKKLPLFQLSARSQNSNQSLVIQIAQQYLKRSPKNAQNVVQTLLLLEKSQFSSS